MSMQEIHSRYSVMTVGVDSRMGVCMYDLASWIGASEMSSGYQEQYHGKLVVASLEKSESRAATPIIFPPAPTQRVHTCTLQVA